MPADLLPAVHLAATWFMVGLIWTIQAVHYPLFGLVGSDGFVAYEAAHTRRMGMLLALPAGLEVVTAALVVARPGDGRGVLWIAGGLLAVVWIMTALVQVPLHRRLSAGFDPASARRLHTSNRWRTALWTARGLLVSATYLA